MSRFADANLIRVFDFYLACMALFSFLRRYGVYRLQYRFKGSSLVLGGKVTEAIRIRRTIRFG